MEIGECFLQSVQNKHPVCSQAPSLLPPSRPLHWGHPHTTSAICPFLGRCQLVARTDIRKRSLRTGLGGTTTRRRERRRLWDDQEEMTLKSPQKGTQFSDSMEPPIKRTLGNSLQGIHKQPTRLPYTCSMENEHQDCSRQEPGATFKEDTASVAGHLLVSVLFWGGRYSCHPLPVAGETTG